MGRHWPGDYATIGDWVYYLLGDNLYRIKYDGTQNMLLQENTDLRRLFCVNNMLFATVYIGPGENEDSGMYWHEAVKLTEYGDIVKILGGGWEHSNSNFVLQQLTDTNMVMIKNSRFFQVDGLVLGLFCTITGGLFSLYNP